MTPNIMSGRRGHSGLIRPRRTALAICLVLGLGGDAASAQFSDGPPYLIPAAAFNLDSSSGTDYKFDFEGGYIFPQGVEMSCLQAPVYLPDSFRIGEFVAHAYDGSGASDMSVGLSRLALAGTSSETLAEVVTSGSAGILSPTDNSLVGAKVSNASYFYFLTMCMSGSVGSDLRLYAIKIGACVDPDLVVDAAKIAEGDNFTACSVLTTTGTVAVASGRAVDFVAGSSVVLSNGFQVDNGAELIVGLDPDLVPPPPADPAVRAAAARARLGEGS